MSATIPNTVYVLIDRDHDAVMAVSDNYDDLLDYWKCYLTCETDYLSFEIDQLFDKMQQNRSADSYQIIKGKTAEPIAKGMTIHVTTAYTTIQYVGTDKEKAYNALRDYLLTESDYDVEEMTEILDAAEHGEVTDCSIKSLVVI